MFVRDVREHLVGEIGELEDGVTVAEVQARLQDAAERFNLDLMEPGTHDRPMAIATLRELARIGLTGASDDLWERAAKIHADTRPNLAQLIGVGAGVLDRWYGGTDDIGILIGVDDDILGVHPDWENPTFMLDTDDWTAEIAAEMIQDAEEHALFDNLPLLLEDGGGHAIFEAILIALVATLHRWIDLEPLELNAALERIS